MEASESDKHDKVRDQNTGDEAPPFPKESTSVLHTPPGKHKRLGQVLKGRYRIESLIASGGMSDVYKAVDRHLEEAGTRDCLVAVKILRPELTRDPNALTLMAREAAKSMRLSHPNIIRVNDLDFEGDTWFMVMELLDGEPLSRVIQRAKPNGLTWKGGQAVLEQVASALAYSHKQGIIHADLKPSNIFFTRDGEVKLLDFGVAQALNTHQHVDFLNPRHDDETTVFGYTPAYASSSLLAGGEPTVKDDLYALACITYELLSSRHPFNRKKLNSKERAAYLLKRPQRMPTPLWRVVRSLLKEDNSNMDMQAFRRALEPTSAGKYLYPASLAASIAVAGLFGFMTYSQTLTAETDRSSSTGRIEMLNTLSDQPPADILAALEGLEPLEQAGLLKHNQDRLVDYYIQSVDEALRDQVRPDLPNFPAAAKELERATAHFPNDARLLRHNDRFQQQNLSLQSALSNELLARLEQGDYRDYAALEDLTELVMDFRFLSDRKLEPTGTALTTYKSQLKAALERDDGAALARLLNVADLFFTDTPELDESLAGARQLEEAIQILGSYHEAVAAGENPAYPHAAAEEFYANRISRWQNEIASATTSDQLDAVYNDMMEQQKSIPSSFEPTAKLRQTLADAYVEQAEQLLNANRARQAQPLLQKATALMRTVDGS